MNSTGECCMTSKWRNELYRGVLHAIDEINCMGGVAWDPRDEMNCIGEWCMTCKWQNLKKKIEHCMTGKARDKAYRGGDGGYKVAWCAGQKMTVVRVVCKKAGNISLTIESAQAWTRKICKVLNPASIGSQTHTVCSVNRVTAERKR